MGAPPARRTRRRAQAGGGRPARPRRARRPGAGGRTGPDPGRGPARAHPGDRRAPAHEGTGDAAARRTTRFSAPLGVVAAFAPWHSPMVPAARHLEAAVAAGCPVVLKAAVNASSAAAFLVRLLAEAGALRCGEPRVRRRSGVAG
ncbi:aldehyde dehydrogenase family protein [Amycolatopsis sp. FDAARGOS 1241]|nr:aldehyde dehydrogenase family protein [Amycolatopsis sp. FDAARGOS 1241]